MARSQGILHIEMRRFTRGNVCRSLCGVWNVPMVGRKWANSGARIKQLCPACRRLDAGGKR